MSQFEKIGCIYFKTISAQAIWEHEILGQLSDGMWENTVPHDHWKFWHRLEARTGDENRILIWDSGNKPWRQKTGYGIGSLVPIIGDRMRVWGRWAKAQGCVGKKNWGLEDLAGYTTFEEFSRQADKVRASIKSVDAQKYFSTTYTEKEFRADIRHIKEAMKSFAQK